MSDAVLFGDAERLLADWLRGEIDAPVSNKVPNPRPPRFVTVRRHGGPRANVVTDAPQIGVEVWGESDADAHDLAQVARSALLYQLRGQVIDGHTVYRVTEIGGPGNLPDPVSNQPRYVFELQVFIRGKAV